jgi:hypothetical protein
VIIGTYAEIEIVLERDTDEIGNRVLSFTGKFFGLGFFVARFSSAYTGKSDAKRDDHKKGC